MPIVADAGVAIRGDLSKWSSDLKTAESQAQGLGQKIQSALSPKALFAGVAGGLGGLFAASKVVDFLGDSIAAASNLGETVSKVGAIFGKEAIPPLEKWAETAAEAFGQSKQSALDAASTFAIFGKSAGLAGDDLIGFSKELTVLASDFASFFNTSPEDAITAIGAALRGESEPIRRYGVLLDEATLRQRAMKLGIIETTTQALTPQQRVLAAQAEILAQTSDAQGDFQRTSAGLANTQRILQAKLADVQVTIGEELLPIMLDLANFTSDTLIPAFKSAIPVLVAVTKVVVELGSTAIPILVAVIGSKLVTALKAAKTASIGFGGALGIIVAGAMVGRDALMDSAAAGIQHEIAMKDGAAAAKRFGQAWIETGGDLQKALDAVKDIPRVVKETGSRATAEQKAALLAGEKEIRDGAKGGITEPITDEIRKGMREAREKAAEEARAIPGDISDALIKGMGDIEDGLGQLVDLMANSLSDAAKIAKLKGILASQELAAGLLDERADVRGAAMQLKEDAEAELQLLESGAADAAVDTGTTFAEQLRLQDIKTRDAANAMLLRAKGVMQDTEWARTGGTDVGAAWGEGVAAGLNANVWRIDLPLSRYAGKMVPASPSPKEGPLHDAEKGAFDIGAAWTDRLAKGLRSGVDAVTAALPTLGANGGVPMFAPSLAAGSVAASGSTINNTWNLTIGGVPFTFNTRDDFIKALDDLSAFGGDGRLGGG